MITRILTSILLFSSIFALDAQNNCSIKNLEVFKGDCNADKKFTAKIIFKYENPGSKGFKILGNGKIYGTFTSVPVVLENLLADCTTPYEFIVRDIEFPECSASFNLGKVCCGPSAACNIKIINVSTTECKEERYKLNFDLLHYDDKKLGFDLMVNGVFHSFHKYSELPLKNIEIASSGNDYETIKICDNDNNKCCDSLEFPSPCKCSIADVRSQEVECNSLDKTYYLKLNFNHHLTSDSFYLAGISPQAKKYAYSSLPLLVGPITFGTSLDLLVADINQTLCFQGYEPKPVKECRSCKLGEIAYEILPCIDEKIYVKLKFKATNPGLKGFSIKGNGIVYGNNYSYNDSIYYVGPIIPNCTQKYEFVIIDNVNGNCSTELNLEEKLCCKSCEIANVVFEPFCKLAETGIDLNFTSSGTSSDSFAIIINGVGIGVFKKTASPLRLIYPFVNGKTYALQIVSMKDQNCFAKKEIEFKCTNNEPCTFKEVNYDLTECTADGQFKMQLFFIAEGMHGDKFYVKVNDQAFGPFVYGLASYIVGPINKVCKNIRLELKDGSNELCKYIIEKELKKCCDDAQPCEINIQNVETICFDNKVIGLKILVPGKEGNAYKLFVDGVDLGLQKYANFPILVNVTPRPEGKFVIKLIDVADPTCFKVLEPSLNCQNCVINDIVVKGVDCTTQSVKLSITFNHANTYSDSVIVVVNSTKIGTFSKNAQPIITPSFPSGITYKVKIFDAKKEACNGQLELKEIDCINATSLTEIHQIKIFGSNQAIVFDNLLINQKYKFSLYSVEGKLIHTLNVANSTSTSIPLTISPQLVIAKVETESGMVSKLVLVK